MNILFLGGVFYNEIIDEIYADSKGNIQNAANLLQWKIINGLEFNLKKSINILNAPFVGSYPKGYKKAFIKGNIYQHSAESDDFSISFINIFGIRNISREYALKKKIREYFSKQNLNEQNVIIIYSLHSPLLEAAKYAKRINPRIKVCVIVPDLPEFMNTSVTSSLIYKILKKIDRVKIQKCIDIFDCYILLTKQMVDPLKIKNKLYDVIEGMTDLKVSDITRFEPCTEKIVLYTGTLNKKYGIIDLVDSFKYIDNEDIKLVICGRGDSEDYIINKSWNDKRIIYKGQLPHSIVRELQLNATILINPRPNDNEFTKYSFPSKILEYLSTGRPVIMFELEGIPDEYDDYVFYINGKGSKKIAETINMVLNIPSDELALLSEKAIHFVKNEKSYINQTKKIINIIRKSFQEDGESDA